MLNYHLLYLSSVYDLYVIVAFRKSLECVCISLDTFLAYYVCILYKYVSDIKIGLWVMYEWYKMQETSLQVESQIRYNYKHIHFGLTCFNSDAVIKDLWSSVKGDICV